MSPRVATLLLTCAAVAIPSCVGSPTPSTPTSRQGQRSAAGRSPQTGARQPTRSADAGTLTVTDASQVDRSAASGDSKPDPARSSSGVSLVIGGMVGQVNGQPIYASEVLSPLDDMLRTMGRQHSREAFRRMIVRPMQDGTRVIPDRLWSIVMNTLVLAEAERDLSDQEQYLVSNELKRRREELLRQSLGSLTLANARTRQRTGRDLNEELDEHRKGMIVERYIRQKLYPKVNVTQRHVKQYYNSHQEEFNEPPGRTLRMIRTGDPRHADRIDQMLAAGEPFSKVASMPLNEKNPQEAGLHSERAAGDRIFGIESLNEAVLSLAEGKHSPRITVGDKHVWLQVEKLHPGSQVTLQEAQQRIRQGLSRMQYSQLFNEYRERLKREGSFTPVEQMTEVLVDVATSLYSAGP
jgi:hypothetical protein